MRNVRRRIKRAQAQDRQQRREYPEVDVSVEQREAKREEARRKWARAIREAGGREVTAVPADATVRPRGRRGARAAGATERFASPQKVTAARLRGQKSFASSATPKQTRGGKKASKSK